jgi:hypothetical protein
MHALRDANKTDLSGLAIHDFGPENEVAATEMLEKLG